MTDVLGTVAMLALAVKGAYDGVQGNKMQCELLNDHVQRVATVLRGIAPSMMKDISSNPAISSLVETLRSAADLITGFKKKNWLKKVVLHASVGAKFEDLFMELDRVLNVCGFAFEVWASLAYFRCFPHQYIIRIATTTTTVTITNHTTNIYQSIHGCFMSHHRHPAAFAKSSFKN